MANPFEQFGTQSENPFARFEPGAALKDEDGPLTRGLTNMRSSVRSASSLLTGDAGETARLASERAAYRAANPGSPEGNELMAAWEAGDGIIGGVESVAGEFAKDWRNAPNAIAGLRATGKNLSAMGAGIVEQVPNMLPPITGLLTGGAAGAAAAGPAGAALGGWAGASVGNTAVEAGEQIDRALQKAGVDPRDRVATEAFLKENGDQILGQAGLKGAIIGAVDTATLGAGHALLAAPAKSAADRALAAMGVDLTDKAAVKLAGKSPEFGARIAGDAAFQASRQGGQALARNTAAAALEPAGEFVGEFVGQGAATGDWDTKGAALEAAMSLGQSGLTFAGQKLYQAATAPGRGAKAPAPGDLIDASNTANAELAGAGDLYAAQAPGNAGRITEQPLTVQNPTTGRITELDRRGGPLERAAVDAVESGASASMQHDDASNLLLPYPTRRAAQTYADSQADPELFEVIAHPSVAGRFAAVPKTGQALNAVLTRRAADAANEASRARAEQLKQEEAPATEAPASKAKPAKKPEPVKPAVPVVDTTADAAQDELAPSPVQPVASMPIARQRAKAQASAAVSANMARAEQLKQEEEPQTIDADAARANTAPTDGQKRAGNFAKGHVRVGGIDIAIENPAGSERTGVEAGKRWKTKLKAHYGYVKSTVGADRDAVDVYVKQGTVPEHDGPVFVVDQYNPSTGAFDEHKALIGYGSQAEAAKAYDAHFGDRSGPKRRGAVTTMAPGEFKTWAHQGDTTQPVSSRKFKGETSDPAQAAQDEIAQSTGARMSRRRDKESQEGYHARMAAEANQRRAERTKQQAVPTKEGDRAEVLRVVREIPGVSPDVRVSILSAATRPDAGKAKGVSKQAAQFIEQVARLFKKRVVFFDTDSPAATSDGFYLRGNTIYLGVDSSVAHLRVLGHELTHAMKAQAGETYQKMLDAVSGLLTDGELQAQHQDYFGSALDAEQLDLPYEGQQTLRQFLAEEWMADLSGNRFTEQGFWSDVFAQLEARHGETAARGIIAKLRLALVNALNKLLALVRGNTFAVDARLAEHLDDIRQAVATGFAEYAHQAKADQLAESETGPAKRSARGEAENQARVIFEVAPDPNDARLSAAWNTLSNDGKISASEAVAGKLIPQILGKFGVKGRVSPQIGGYLGESNPSFTILLEGGNPDEIARASGHILSQDMVVAVSDRPFDRGEKTGAVTIYLPKGADVAAVYARIYAKVKEAEGHTTVDGQMILLNNPKLGIGTQELGARIDTALDGEYDVRWNDDVYASFPEKENYGYDPATRTASPGSPDQAWAGELRTEANRLLESELRKRGIRFSRARPDATSDRQLGGNGASGLRRPVQPESVSAEGIHYSKAQRERLDSSYFGTGEKGAETQRVRDAEDPRIKHRIYFYVNSGKGIKPEEGVGSHAHRAQLDNLYDYVNDPLDLRATNTFSGFESAVIDKGFDGAINHERGIAVLLGERNLAVEYVGQDNAPKVASAGRAAPSTFGQQLRAVAGNNALPAGETTGAEWKRTMATAMPEVDVSHLDDARKYYKNEIIKRPEKFSPARRLYEWQSQTTNSKGPVYHGKGFTLEAVRKHQLGGGDFQIENGMPWGHAAFVEDDAYRFAVLDAQGRSVGFLDAEVNGLDEISAIHDLAIGLPGTGLGTRIVEAILASTYDGVRVIDVLPQSEKFWDRLGAGSYDINKNTRIDFEGSPAAARYRAEGSAGFRRTEAGRGQEGTGRQGQEDRGVKRSEARPNGLPTSTPAARTVDGAELATLRRAAAGLERPRDGIFLRVTGDGRAIATGPKGARIPDTFRRFAADHRLRFYAGREVPNYAAHVMAANIDLGLSRKAEPMPIDYRQSGALYFGEIGATTLDRTDKTRFSPQRLAPNGKPSNLNERQWHQVRTPEFRAWFGDWEAAHNGKDGNGVWAHENVSKIVDINGEPLVAYHGTEKGGFTIFRPDKADKHRSPMIFAAATRGTARTYAGHGAEIDLPGDPESMSDFEALGYRFEDVGEGRFDIIDPNGGVIEEGKKESQAIRSAKWDFEAYGDGYDYDAQTGVYSLFLNIRNPNEAHFEGANWDGAPRYGAYEVWNTEDDEQVYAEDGRGTLSEEEAAELVERLGEDTHEVRPASDRFETTNSVAEDAKSHGHDGAIIRSTVDDGGRGGFADVDDVFVVFDANQAKSATQNTGAFSLRNDDIRYSPQRLSQEFETKLQAHFNAKQSQPIKLADNTPASLQLFGWNDLPVVVSPNVIDKMYFDHGMTVSQMARLPHLLKRPLMIFADGENMSLVFVGEHLAPGKIALVAIKPETQTMLGTDKVSSNMVVTGYAPHNGWAEVTKRVSRGELVYLDTIGEIPEIVRGALASAQKKYAQFGRGLPRELLQGSTPRTYGDSSEKTQSGTRSPTVSAAFAVLGRAYNVMGQSALVKLENDIWPDGVKFSPARAQTQTPEFKAWFRDSKVVDENGEPLVMYHGTSESFDAFDVEKDSTKKDHGYLGRGFYFSTSFDTAGSYANLKGGYAGPNTMPVYLSVQNPLRLRMDLRDTKIGMIRRTLKLPYSLAYETVTPAAAQEVTDKLRERGHDGVELDYSIFAKAGLPVEKEVVVFSPAQIKSAIGNNGAFSPDDPDIRRSPARATLGALTPAQHAAANHVLGAPKTFGERLADFKRDWAKNLKQGIFDQFAPIAELDPKAYILARLSKGGDSTLEALMLYGKLSVGADGATNVRYTKAGGLQGFAGKMAALKGEQDRFMLWVAAQRADRLKAIGLENLWSVSDIAELKTLNTGAMKDGTPRLGIYKQALDDLNAFNDNVLEVAVASGLIDAATRQMYQGTPYVPFYRLQEEGDVAGFGVKPGLVNQYAWKKLKGGTDKLNEDLLANLLHNWSHLITASAKNRAAKATLLAAERAGIATRIPAGAPGKGHVSFKDNGTERVFVVGDPHLMDAVAALEYAGLGPWSKPFAAAKHWLTLGVTANPAFKIRNLIRDTIGALGTAQLSYNAPRNLAQGWAATAKDSETRARMLAAGGMIRFGSMLDGTDSQRAQDLINQGVDPAMILDDDGKIQAFYKRYLRPALSAYNELGDRGEQINRAALYEQLTAKGMAHAEAAFWARDLMDFSMAGKWTAIRMITQTVPFFNARLQGLYKLGRAGKQDIRRLGYVLGAVSIASLALLLAYGDDEDWKRRSDADRNNYWWFKLSDDLVFRVPKPFEIGAVGTLAERGYELMANPEMTGKQFGKSMRDIVMSQLSMNPVPQLFKPMMDLYANKDSFTGRDIESMGLERLRKEDRYDERTSEVARFLGGLGLPDPTQLAMGRWDTLSPKQIDFLTRAYFSWLGTMATTVLDYGIRPMLDRGDRPDRQLRDVFLAGNFVETLPSNSSRYVQQLYDQAREIEQAYASYHARLKLGDVAGAQSILADERENILRRPMAENLVRAESLINVQVRRVEANQDLSGAEKRARLDELYARRNRIAEHFRAQ